MERELLVLLRYSCPVRKGDGVGGPEEGGELPHAGGQQGLCKGSATIQLAFCLCQGFSEVGGLPSWALAPWQIGRQREVPLDCVLTAELGWRLRN